MDEITQEIGNNSQRKADIQAVLQILPTKYSAWSQRIQQVLREVRLVGMTDFSETEYSEMIVLLQIWCNIPASIFESFVTIDDDFKLFVFVTLVEISKRWKNQNLTNADEEETAFWPFVIKTLTRGKESENANLYRRVTTILNDIMNDERWFVVAPVRSKYYGTLMMHALAPEKSLYSFFDLCFNVYKNDLDYGYSIDDKFICKIVATEVYKVLNRDAYNEEKKVSIGSSAYSIKIGLKGFISHPKLQNDFENFTDYIFLKINDLYYNNDFQNNSRIDKLIHEWWDNKISFEKLPKVESGSIRRETVSKQNICVTYTFSKDAAYLSVPSIRLENINDKVKIIIEAGHATCEQSIITWQGEFIIKSKAVDYELNKLLANTSGTLISIRVKVYINNEMVYDSRETLNREFVLFKDGKEVHDQFVKPTNYFIYSIDIDGISEIPGELYEISKNLFNIYPLQGESIIGKRRQFYFVEQSQIGNSKDKITLLGLMDNVRWRNLDNVYFNVAKGDIFLLIPEHFNLKGLELRCDNKRILVSQLTHISSNGIYVFNLKEVLESAKPFVLQVFSFDKNKVLLVDGIIYFPQIKVEFDKKFYFGDENKSVSVSFDSSIETTTWNNQDEKVQIPFLNGYIAIDVPFLKWRIGYKEWHLGPIKGRKWYKDIVNDGDKIEVVLPKRQYDCTLLVKSEGETISEKLNNRDYPIGRLIYSMKNEQKILIRLIVDDNKQDIRKRYDLLTVSKNQHFASNPIVYKDGKIYWDVENTYVGERQDDFFAIIKQNNNNQYRLKLSGENRELGELKGAEGLFTVIIKLKATKMFCSDNKYVEIFRDSNFKIGDSNHNRFSGKQLHVTHVWIQGGPRIKLNLGYNIRELQPYEYGESTYYLGKLYLGNNLIDKMINEKGEIEIINPVRVEIDNDHTFWMVVGWKDDYDFIECLYYDFSQRCLCNIAIDSLDIKPIEKYEYTL